MPIAPTYPGVYVEEIPSGVRTIVGVATSITAFVGRTLWGPLNEPTRVSSLADFEQRFGGVAAAYPMTYAVKDFFVNGGTQGLIVRLYKKGTTEGVATVTHEELKLEAASPGRWGSDLRLSVDYNGIDAEVGKRFGLADTDLWNVTVTVVGPDGLPRSAEQIRNVTFKPDSPRRVDRILAQESSLARVRRTSAGAPDLPSDPTKQGRPKLKPDPNVQGDKPAEFTGGEPGQPLDLDAWRGQTRTGNDVVKTPRTGIFALEKADLFNLLCLPPDTHDGDLPKDLWVDALNLCQDQRAVLLADPPFAWGANPATAVSEASKGSAALGLTGVAARNAALYFPRLLVSDPARENQVGTFVACGAIAGVLARTDAQRGVWKAPAGLDATLAGTSGLQVTLNDADNGVLNPLGVNCLRTFPVFGDVIWGARTSRGADQLADEYKYLPVRRVALYIEESLYRGLQWVVFEPNDEPLWAQIRLNVGAFMQDLFRQGAFQGQTPREAYLVKCDKETTTQSDINRGIVNILVGFAPLKPAEFVFIKLQQLAGQIAT
jgi:uncharacterized protein